MPIAVFAVLFALTLIKLIDMDLWFHMKSGEVILDTGHFLYEDIFTFTAQGRPWLYHEWLFGIIAFKVYSLFGPSGLVLGKSLLLTLAFLFIYKDSRLRGTNPWLALLLLLLAVFAARFRFTARPQIFMFLLTPLFIYIIDLYCVKQKNYLWLLPLLELLWVNVHGSFIIGPAIIAIYALDVIISGNKNKGKGLGIFFLLTSAVCLINPYGFKLILFTLGFGKESVLSSITEWRPTRIHHFYSAFGLLFTCGILSFILRGRNIRAADILLFLFFACLSIKAIRFTALFSLAVTPVIASNLESFFSNTRRIKELKIPVKATLLLLALTLFISLGYREISRERMFSFGIGREAAYSEKGMEFLRKHPIEGNMYNTYHLGGFLIWSLYPEKKVFLDGRAEIYDHKFVEDFTAKASPRKWFEAVRKYNINYAVITYSGKGLDIIGEWISESPGWILVYWDHAVRVYVKNSPPNGALIERFGHRVSINPWTIDNSFMMDALSRGQGEQLMRELKGDLESNAGNVKASHWLGMIYYELGKKDEAVMVWEATGKLSPNADIFSNIGNVFLEKRDYNKAALYYKKAVNTKKDYAIAYYNLGLCFDAMGQKEEARQSYRTFIKYAGSQYDDIVRDLKKRLK
ncbi:MAG: tetratricopeptide repeat protein [Deltaproteobacteria bacterium]|nr:tetratricopeptide repeat protein [Deltaproteobacteria bacterium]